MTDRERLENMSSIGFDLNGNVLLKSEDYHWLMEQAERIEELELEINDWRAEVQKWQQFYNESEESHLETKELLKNIVNQNKRLREAIIEAISDIEAINPHEAKKTLRETLINGEN